MNIKELCDKVNNALGSKFCENFAYERKRLAGLKKAPNRNKLFVYEDKDIEKDPWAINEGGGTEIQFHIFINGDRCGYGLGFNAQYVPFRNEKSSEEYIRPFARAYIKLKESEVVKRLKASGFSFLEGKEDKLSEIFKSEYYLFGKTINIDDQNAFENMINDIKGDLFTLYCDIFELKNKEDKEMNDIQDLSKLLCANHNLILTGAPGTGKTFLANKIAYAMTGDSDENHTHVEFVQFHPSYDYTDFVEGLRPTPPDENENIGFKRQNGVFKDFCQQAIFKQKNNFDEAYKKLCQNLADNYSKDNPLDMEKPENFKVWLNRNGNLSFVAGNSSSGSLTVEKLKTFLTRLPYKYWGSYYGSVIDCLREKYDLENVSEESEQKYVFIIDEINRGDIAKIFGELFFAIDPGYRGEKGRIKTQYQNLIEDDDVFKDGFYVPDNVYIIGTMNDIDRNVESMDFAIRRRFTWKEITPEYSKLMWEGDDEFKSEWKEKAKLVMTNINEKISNTEVLGPQYQLGAAYFMKLKDYDGDFDKLWKYHINPLLHEYLRGMPKADDLVGDLEEVWNGALKNDKPNNG